MSTMEKLLSNNIPNDILKNHSEELNNVLNIKSNIFEQWILLFFLGLLFILLGCAHFISYPEVIEWPATIDKIHVLDSNNSNIKYQYYARSYVAESNLDQISIGMSVDVKLDAYPYAKYGILKGRLVTIADSITKKGCPISIYIGNNLITTQGNLLIYKKGLNADAFIVIEDISLLKKLYYTLIKNI